MPGLPIGLDGLPPLNLSGGDSISGRVQFGGITFPSFSPGGGGTQSLVILGVAAVAAIYLLRR